MVGVRWIRTGTRETQLRGREGGNDKNALNGRRERQCETGGS